MQNCDPKYLETYVSLLLDKAEYKRCINQYTNSDIKYLRFLIIKHLKIEIDTRFNKETHVINKESQDIILAKFNIYLANSALNVNQNGICFRIFKQVLSKISIIKK